MSISCIVQCFTIHSARAFMHMVPLGTQNVLEGSKGQMMSTSPVGRVEVSGRPGHFYKFPHVVGG